MKRGHGRMWAATLAIIATITAAPAVFATYLHDGASTVWIGQAWHGGTKSAWLCESNGGNAVWTNLGSSSGLSAGYTIHGDSCDSCSGDDNMYILFAPKTVTGGCAADSGGSWEPLLYNSHYLDLYGDYGNDYLQASTGDTILHGYFGNDTLDNRGTSTFAASFGEYGDDVIWGNAGSSDDLRGGGGTDCLEDYNNAWSVFNCGGDTVDKYYSGNSGTMTGCNTAVSCCGVGC